MWREGEGKPHQTAEPPVSASILANLLRWRRKMRSKRRNRGLQVRAGLICAGTKDARDSTLRWLTRSNSIRRSNAFERMMGNRARIFSRTFGKSDAIRITFLVSQPGNGRGSEIVSDNSTRR